MEPSAQGETSTSESVRLRVDFYLLLLPTFVCLEEFDLLILREPNRNLVQSFVAWLV